MKYSGLQIIAGIEKRAVFQGVQDWQNKHWKTDLAASLLIPGYYGLSSLNNAGNSFRNGRYLGAVGHLGAAALGLIPFVGGAMKGIGAAGRGVTYLNAARNAKHFGKLRRGIGGVQAAVAQRVSDAIAPLAARLSPETLSWMSRVGNAGSARTGVLSKTWATRNPMSLYLGAPLVQGMLPGQGAAQMPQPQPQPHTWGRDARAGMRMAGATAYGAVKPFVTPNPGMGRFAGLPQAGQPTANLPFSGLYGQMG